MKTFYTTIHENYVLGWGFKEALRELLQNAIDQGDPDIKFDSLTKSIKITNPGVTLSQETLYLGSTTKANDVSCIGQYGEGYKLACLVLVRMGYTVTIDAGYDEWVPQIVSSPTHPSIDVLAFEIYSPDPNSSIVSEPQVQFRIEGLKGGEANVLSEIYLDSSESNKFDTAQGEILIDSDHRGAIYLGGLFVMHNADFKYGYNIKPDFLSLERDRNTVSDFDAQWVLKNMWYDASYNDEDALELAVDMIFESTADIRFIHNANITPNHPLVEAVYLMFRLKYGDNAVVTESQDQADAIAHAGVRTVTNYGPLGNMLRYHSGYTRSLPAPRYGPTQLMLNFYRENKKYMKRAAQSNFKELLAKSANWKDK